MVVVLTWALLYLPLRHIWLWSMCSVRVGPGRYTGGGRHRGWAHLMGKLPGHWAGLSLVVALVIMTLVAMILVAMIVWRVVSLFNPGQSHWCLATSLGDSPPRRLPCHPSLAGPTGYQLTTAS